MRLKSFIPAQGPLLQGIVISVSPVQFRPPFVALREIDLKPVVVPLPPHDVVQGSHSLQWPQIQSTGPKSTREKNEIQLAVSIWRLKFRRNHIYVFNTFATGYAFFSIFREMIFRTQAFTIDTISRTSPFSARKPSTCSSCFLRSSVTWFL